MLIPLMMCLPVHDLDFYPFWTEGAASKGLPAADPDARARARARGPVAGG